MPIPEPKASVPLPAAGEDAALAMLEQFVKERGAHYEARRDLPALDGTSSLSPHFHLGILSPRTAAHGRLPPDEVKNPWSTLRGIRATNPASCHQRPCSL